MQNLNSENVKKVRVKLFCRKSFVLRHLHKFSGLGILTQGCTLLNFYFFVNLELICWKFAQWCLFLHLHLVTDKFNREQGIRIRRALFLFISPELDRFRRHKLWLPKTSIFGGSSTFWKEWRSFFLFIQLQYWSQAMNWIQWDWHRIMHHLLLKMQSTNIFDNRTVLLALVLSTLLVHRHVKSTIETQDWVRY